ncbi:hypothetical protein LJR034_007334 [Caballeronia sp. LjRoot34]|uniref:hypothetical protein n=1 Tax=Caballeronia sp. LjRoot34 TaxID=3342325 RepID=UPI003ECF1E40
MTGSSASDSLLNSLSNLRHPHWQYRDRAAMLPVHAPADGCVAFAKISSTSLNCASKTGLRRLYNGCHLQIAYCRLAPRDNALVITTPADFAKGPFGGWQRPVPA